MVVRSVSVIGSVLSRAGAPVSAQIAIESQFPLKLQSASLLPDFRAQWLDQRTFGRLGVFEFSCGIAPASGPEGRIASMLTSGEKCPRRVPLVTHRMG
jgi:hypothetical protein